MKKLFTYLTRQPFWVNLLAALLLVFLIGFLFLQSLSWFTNHGAYLKVPEVKGQNVDNAIKILESQGFEVVIQDSIYFDSIPRYTVIKQLPDPDATVKVNRTVYLTILLTHTILAASVPVLAIITLRRALKGNFPHHRKIARWTLPIWMYVNVTGVVVYLMLYQF